MIAICIFLFVFNLFLAAVGENKFVKFMNYLAAAACVVAFVRLVL